VSVVPVLDGSFLGDRGRDPPFDVTLVCPLAFVDDVYKASIKSVGAICASNTNPI
jgi:hypothetical protein